jgi:hypothetical protein
MELSCSQRIRGGDQDTPRIAHTDVGIDWENYFATLEDLDGRLLASWLYGAPHA